MLDEHKQSIGGQAHLQTVEKVNKTEQKLQLMQ